jgi:hypothetical protein
VPGFSGMHTPSSSWQQSATTPTAQQSPSLLSVSSLNALSALMKIAKHSRLKSSKSASKVSRHRTSQSDKKQQKKSRQQKLNCDPKQLKKVYQRVIDCVFVLYHRRGLVMHMHLQPKCQDRFVCAPP